jgi:hypothetical protein
LVAYVVSTRRFRQDMDVPVFMATICPIAAVAVLPLAIANGDMFGMSGTGWTYMLILTFVSGVAANGLLVYAQKTIAIGTIAIGTIAIAATGGSTCARGGVVVPTAGRDAAWRAVRRHRHGPQRAGRFIVINQRGERRRMNELVVPATASEGPGAPVVR